MWLQPEDFSVRDWQPGQFFTPLFVIAHTRKPASSTLAQLDPGWSFKWHLEQICVLHLMQDLAFLLTANWHSILGQ